METDFIPCRPEFLTKDWLMMVLNQYRSIKEQSLIRCDDGDDDGDGVMMVMIIVINQYRNNYAYDNETGLQL